MRMIPIIASIGFVACAIPSPTLADHIYTNLSQSPGESRFCEIAASANGMMVVIWQEGESAIWTRSRYPDGAWTPAVQLGTGIGPDVTCGFYGFTIAYETDGGIVVRSGWGDSWSEPILFGSSGSERPHLWAKESIPGVDALLAWEDSGESIWFAYRSSGAWSEPEWVGDAANPGGLLSPKAVLTAAHGGTVRVFYFDDFTLKYRDRLYSWWWSDPIAVDSDWAFGTEFDVEVDSARQARIVSLLEPPL